MTEDKFEEIPQVRCPYTLSPLAELDEDSREHIICDALGGPNGYAVRACRKENNRLGESVDAAFLEDPVVEIARLTQKISSRSGLPKWKVRAESVDGNRPVDVTFNVGGKVDVRHRKPVEIDPETGSRQIIATESDAQELLQEMKTNLAKKGKKIVEVSTTRSENQELHLKAVVNLTAIRAGLSKIAYLACFRFLGDEFLDDPLNGEWQKAIHAVTAEDAENVRIHGTCFAEAKPADLFFSDLHDFEHGILIADLGQLGPVVAVRLFGSPILTLVCRASDTSSFGMNRADGTVLIFDSRDKTYTETPFVEFLSKKFPA